MFYKLPRVNYKYFVDGLEESIAIATSHYGKVFCLSDFNIIFIDIESPEYKYFPSMLYSCNLHQLVSEATHITDHSRSLMFI